MFWHGYSEETLLSRAARTLLGGGQIGRRRVLITSLGLIGVANSLRKSRGSKGAGEQASPIESLNWSGTESTPIIPDEYEFIDFSAAGWQIHGASAGSGPLLVFLHGFGLSWLWWKPIMDRMKNDFSVLAIDLPGSGASSDLATFPSAEELKELVEQTIAQSGQAEAVVVGHSLGGYVGVRAAIAGASGLKGLALVAPAGFGPVENKLLKAMSLPGVGEVMGLTGKTGARILLDSMVYDPKSLPEYLVDTIDLSGEARKRFLEQLRIGLDLGETKESLILKGDYQLPFPVNIVWGQHDSLFPVSYADRAEKILNTNPAIIFNLSGHFPQIEEESLYEEILRRFLESI